MFATEPGESPLSDGLDRARLDRGETARTESGEHMHA